MNDYVFEGELELRVDVISSPQNLRREHPYVNVLDEDGIMGTFTIAGEFVEGDLTKPEQEWLADTIRKKRSVLEAIIANYREEQGV